MKFWTSLLILAAISANAADAPTLETTVRDGFSYRNLGPFRAGSWIADIAVPEKVPVSHLYTFYVGARNGGVWKTTNNGTTFAPMFDDQGFLSIGALAVTPSDDNILWVGTGDASCTRSARRGDGVYKSTDAGKTWLNMGLAETHHISRIQVHPANPEIVYVAAMGHLYSTNADRGVFKTTDGGRTWKKVLFISDQTGIIDLALDRRHPNTLYAASYQCTRAPWRIFDGGPETGIYKTTDGGSSWQKLKGGLPDGSLGRIGLALYQKDPKTLFALIDNRNVHPPSDASGQPQSNRGAVATTPRLVGGEVYRTDDFGKTWRKMSSPADDLSRKTGYAFNQIRVNPENPDQLFITGETLSCSTNSGRTWTSLTETRAYRPFRKAFGDFRTLWIDPANPDRMLAGSDGGVAVSYDGGRTCDHFANLMLGEIYALAVDMENPYHIYAGLQDHESWKGPSNGWSDSVGEEDWTTVGVGDGMYNQVDPTDSRWIYNTQEFGRHARLDQKLRVRKVIAPTRPPGQPMLRFNWVAPLRLSPHDPKTIYAGAQVLFRSRDRGDHWEEISPDLTGNDTNKISPRGASIQFCTITTISESPAAAEIIWVGTDDGKVQVTTNSGATWTDATPAIASAGGPEDAWVTRVFAAPSAPGTAYVAKSRHHQDDFRPYLFKTTDFGATWTPIMSNLPQRPVNVVFEDSVNSNLLFAGTDCGVYVSFNGGANWSALRGNMPPAAVEDLVVHPRDGDVVVGTYGRGIWVTDITPLREFNDRVADEDVHFFAVRPRAWRHEGSIGNYHLYGDRHAVTLNEPNGLTFEYYLKRKPADKVTIRVADAEGKAVRTLDGTAEVGLNRVAWNARPLRQYEGEGGPNVREPAPGDYQVTLVVGGRNFVQKAVVLPSETPRDSDESDKGDGDAEDEN